MQPQHTAFAPAPDADTSTRSDAGFDAGLGARRGRHTGARSTDQPGTKSDTGTLHNESTSGAPRASDIVVPTLAAIVKGLVAVRAEIHALHAVEATLLALGDSIVEEVAVREQHTDHGESEHRALAAELAAAVHESDRTMAGRITRAVTLVQDFPDVHRALQKGRISQTHATLITDAGMIITDDTARSIYAAAALEIAQVETPGRVRSLVKELAERFANRTLDERHQEARSCRMVRVVELGDGMADLTATLPAVYAYGIKDRLNQMARGIKQHEQALADAATKAGPAGSSTGSGFCASSDSGSRAGSGAGFASADPTGEPQPTPRIVRSIDQIRADLLTDMLLATDPNNAALSGFNGITGLRARVQVIVPRERLGNPRAESTSEQTSGPEAGTEAKTETGAQSESKSAPGPAHAPASAPAQAPAPAPATLAGYGPIDTDTARQLAGHANHWEEITVNPNTGTVLSVDTYRPNTKLKQFLRARDLHCRFPGCHTPTVRCDIDHTVDAALGGPTASTNLAHLCRRHHTLKHHSKWSVIQATDGTLTWTSPLGTNYTERPPSTVRFKPMPVSNEQPQPRSKQGAGPEAGQDARHEPSREPSHEPSHEPSREPSHEPNSEPSHEPNSEPSSESSPKPSSESNLAWTPGSGQPPCDVSDVADVAPGDSPGDSLGDSPGAVPRVGSVRATSRCDEWPLSSEWIRPFRKAPSSGWTSD